MYNYRLFYSNNMCDYYYLSQVWFKTLSAGEIFLVFTGELSSQQSIIIYVCYTNVIFTFKLVFVCELWPLKQMWFEKLQHGWLRNRGWLLSSLTFYGPCNFHHIRELSIDIRFILERRTFISSTLYHITRIWKTYLYARILCVKSKK